MPEHSTKPARRGAGCRHPPRMSNVELELDACMEDILNRDEARRPVFASPVSMTAC